MTDPIADMLIRIKNGQAAKKAEVVIPYSNLKWQVANLLFKEGYLQAVEKIDIGPQKIIKIILKYSDGKPALSEVKRVSKPSRRVYVGYKEIPQVLNGLGLAVISTPKGVLTGQEAKAKHLGGELICEVY